MYQVCNYNNNNIDNNNNNNNNYAGIIDARGRHYVQKFQNSWFLKMLHTAQQINEHSCEIPVINNILIDEAYHKSYTQSYNDCTYRGLQETIFKHWKNKDMLFQLLHKCFERNGDLDELNFNAIGNEYVKKFLFYHNIFINKKIIDDTEDIINNYYNHNIYSELSDFLKKEPHCSDYFIKRRKYAYLITFIKDAWYMAMVYYQHSKLIVAWYTEYAVSGKIGKLHQKNISYGCNLLITGILFHAGYMKIKKLHIHCFVIQNYVGKDYK